MLSLITDAVLRHKDLNNNAEESYSGVELKSYYVVMRDMVKIAVDLYLPVELDTDDKLPAILHQTRYFRRQKYKLFSKILRHNKKNAKRKVIDRFVRNGYAYVNIDVRGSGASLGTRNMEWSPDEVKDAAEIVDWIVKQPWSDGKVAAIGLSYTATAAEMLLINKHPAVKAAVIQNSLFDTYSDILMPGGVRNESFLSKWAMLNKFRDMNILPDTISGFNKIFLRFLINGAAPVSDDKEGGKLLCQAKKDHLKNYDIYKSSCLIKFRDDISRDGLTLDDFSPHNFVSEIQKSKTPIYNWSGWYDGAYQRSAINRYLNVKIPGSRLLLGPWDHGGNHTADPFVDINQIKTNFDYVGEIILFLNKHLKGENNILTSLSPVSYYTIGEGKWKFSDKWPVPGFKQCLLYFNDSKSLSDIIPARNHTYKYIVDKNTTSGKTSRWKSQVNIEKKRIEYKFLKDFDSGRLCFDSMLLKEELEVTGHPLISLYLQSEESDFQLFVYLEEIEESGRVNYVTEGVFRVIHRKISTETSPYKTLTPNHSFKLKNALPLSSGEIALITFDMFPISYLFKKGSKIRIAIAGVDADNFEIYPQKHVEFNVFATETCASYISLPVNRKPEFVNSN